METYKEKTDDSSNYYGCIKVRKDGEFFSVFVCEVGIIMIVDERMVTFIRSLETENSEILEQIEKEA